MITLCWGFLKINIIKILSKAVLTSYLWVHRIHNFWDPAGSGSRPDPEMLDLAKSGSRPDPNALDPAGSGSSMIHAVPYLLKTAISAPQFEAFGLIVSMNSCQKLQDFYQL